MAIPSLRRFWLPTVLGGVFLWGLSSAWDLSPFHAVVPLPLSPIAFLVFLATLGLLTRTIRRAEDETSTLNQTIGHNLEDLQSAAEAYGRFVPGQFLRHLNRDSIAQVRLGDQVERTMTVFFSDIRNFTTISEKMTPQENFGFLNTYLGHIGPVIREHFGFIDKYIGDSVMALFDGPVDEALAAAVAVQLATAGYNAGLDPGQDALTIGIGMHSGPLMLGIIGEKDRMESTVIADAVNLASRIESLTKHYDCRILVTRSTFEAQMEPQPYLTRPVDLVRVKGKTASVELLEILNDQFDPRAPVKNDLAAHLAEAMMVYRRGDFFGARSLFQSLAYKDPQDVLYGIFRRRIEEYIRLGVPAGWDGTTVFDVK